MPRDLFKPLTPQEQKFIFHFVREGCHEEKLYLVERKAHIPKGKGVEILRRKHVLLELERRKAGVELEQNRLIARDQNRKAEEEDKRRTVTLDKIETALDKIIGLDPEKFGNLVLNGVQTGLVYTGTIRSGRMERMQPPKENSAENDFYRSIFDPMRRAAEKDLKDDAPAPLFPGESEGDAAPAQPVSRPPETKKAVEIQIT